MKNNSAAPELLNGFMPLASHNKAMIGVRRSNRNTANIQQRSKLRFCVALDLADVRWSDSIELHFDKLDPSGLLPPRNILSTTMACLIGRQDDSFGKEEMMDSKIAQF